MSFLKKYSKHYKELLLVLAGVNLGLLVYSFALESVSMLLLNAASFALMLLAYDLSPEEEE